MKLKLTLQECAFLSTRFNSSTWEENQKYRREKLLQISNPNSDAEKPEKEKPFTCIYGVPLAMSQKIPCDKWIFICEMRNDLNQICGIGLVQNRIYYDKYYLIYKDGNYNRHVYKGHYYISRETILRHAPQLLEHIETILFKGKGHSKRGQGFTSIPEKHFTTNPAFKNVKADILSLFTSGIVE